MEDDYEKQLAEDAAKMDAVIVIAAIIIAIVMLVGSLIGWMK